MKLTRAIEGTLKNMLARERISSPLRAVERREPRKSMDLRSAYSAVRLKLTNTTEVVTNAVTMILDEVVLSWEPVLNGM